MARTTREVYNRRWREVRLHVLERDGYRCQIRGPRCTTWATQVDHIVPWRMGGALYDEANLRACCARCNRDRVSGEPVRRPSREW